MLTHVLAAFFGACSSSSIATEETTVGDGGSGPEAPTSGTAGTGNAAPAGSAGEEITPSDEPPAPPVRPDRIRAEDLEGHIPSFSRCEAVVPGPPIFRLLSPAEYERAVEDLLGHPARHPNRGSEFLSTAVDEQQFMGLFANALSAAEIAAAEHLRLAPCDVTEPSLCAEELVRHLGRKAYRRPLTGKESQRLLAVAEYLLPTSDLTEALKAVIATLLLSPRFLYQSEFPLTRPFNLSPLREPIGPGAPRRPRPTARLDSHQIASRLSFGLWGTIPDDELLSAADAGLLEDRKDLNAQIERLLSSPRFAGSVRDMHRDWLGLNAGELPGVGLAGALVEETERFAVGVYLGPEPTLPNLWLSSSSVVNDELWKYYGLEGAAPGSGEWVERDLSGIGRVGLFTQGSVLSRQRGISARGENMRRQALCIEPRLIDPVPEQRPQAAPNQTQRQLMDSVRLDPGCDSCHSHIDPLGYAFEAWDEQGVPRTLDVDNQPVVTSGALPLESLPHRLGIPWASQDAAVEYDNARELLGALLASEAPWRCVARQWAFRAKRSPITQRDECLIEHALWSQNNADLSLIELVKTTFGLLSLEVSDTPSEFQVQTSSPTVPLGTPENNEFNMLVLDAVVSELHAFVVGLPSGPQEILEQHVTAVRTVERDVSLMPGGLRSGACLPSSLTPCSAKD